MARLTSLGSYGAYLAMRHAQDQEAIAADLAVSMYTLWSLLDFEELDDSTLLWLPAVLPRIRLAFLQSQRVTAVFTQNARFAALPTEEPLQIGVPNVELPAGLSPLAFEMPAFELTDPLPVFEDFNPQAVAEKLTVQANYMTKKAMPGPPEQLMNDALVRSSGEAIKRATDGSRGVSRQVLKRDPKATGWARVTDSDPCYFCALLASRGAYYKTKTSFKASDAKWDQHPDGAKDLPKGFTGIAKVHNNCCCTLRPVFGKSSGMDAAARYYRQGWNKVKDVNEFRAWLKRNPFPGSQFDMYSLRADLENRREALLDAGFDPDSPQVVWAEKQLSVA